MFAISGHLITMNKINGLIVIIAIYIVGRYGFFQRL